MSTTAVAGVRSVPAHGSVQPGWAPLVRAEFRRVRSTKGWLILLGVAVLLAGFGSVSVGVSLGKPHGVDPHSTDGVARALSSGFTASLVAGILATLMVTSEFRYRTAGQSMVDSTSRTRWFLAKMPAVVTLGLLYSLVAQVVTLLVGLPFLWHTGVHPDIWHGTLLRMSIGTVAIGVPGAVWGAVLGLACRSQIGTVVGLIVYSVMAEAAVIQFLPDIGRWLPGGAQAALVADPSLPYHDGWLGALVFAGWIGLAGVIGIVRLNRTDVAG